MASQNNFKKPVVWQDIKPVNSAPQINKTKKVGKFALFLVSFKKPWIRLIFVLKNLHKIGSKFKKLKTRNKIIVSLSVIAILAVVGVFIIKPNFVDKQFKANGVKIEELAAKTPQFKTFLPEGKTIDELGGWHKLTPPNSSVVFVFLDKIDNVRIRVTQQTMPEDFLDDKNSQIEQLAKNFKADEKITVGDTAAYVGTNISGVQSVIFEKENTMILITSASKISNESWSKYIADLN